MLYTIRLRPIITLFRQIYRFPQPFRVLYIRSQTFHCIYSPRVIRTNVIYTLLTARFSLFVYTLNYMGALITLERNEIN